MVLAPGSRLAQYEIVSAVGSGGMGVVYRARDTRLNREVALKVMAPHIASDPAMRTRFETEGGGGAWRGGSAVRGQGGARSAQSSRENRGRAAALARGGGSRRRDCRRARGRTRQRHRASGPQSRERGPERRR